MFVSTFISKASIFSFRYGPPKVAQRIANLSLEAMIYLAKNEFTSVEKQGRLGVLVSLYDLIM